MKETRARSHLRTVEQWLIAAPRGRVAWRLGLAPPLACLDVTLDLEPESPAACWPRRPWAPTTTGSQPLDRSPFRLTRTGSWLYAPSPAGLASWFPGSGGFVPSGTAPQPRTVRLAGAPDAGRVCPWSGPARFEARLWGDRPPRQTASLPLPYRVAHACRRGGSRSTASPKNGGFRFGENPPFFGDALCLPNPPIGSSWQLPTMYC